MAEKRSPQTSFLPTGVPWCRADSNTSVVDMLKTDLSTFKRHPFFPVSPRTSAADSQVDKAPSPSENLCQYIPDVEETTDHGKISPANKLIPGEERQNSESTFKFGELSRKYDDAGVKFSRQAGVREYLKSGYTRSNPNGTTAHDTDWKGKWKELDLQVVEKTWAKGGVSAVEKTFGDPAKDWASGEFKAGTAQGGVTSGLSITKKGIDAKAAAKGSIAAAEGKVEVNKDGLASGSAEGAILKAQAEAETAFVANPEEVTLKGKLSASANVIEGKVNGEFCVTPTRVGNAFIRAYNWAFEDHTQFIEDKWDIGVCLGGELQGAVGAQAEGTAEASYQKGKARAEIGGKLGFGLGGGAKASGGLTGMDKAADLVGGWMGK